MDRVVKLAVLSVFVEIVSCTIVGLTYMDSLNLVPSKPLRGDDPCNPLYWYPRQIPDYCYFPKPDVAPRPAKPTPVPVPLPPPNAMPIPVPLPPPNAMPIPVPMPMYVPLPGPPAIPLPIGPMPMPVPFPAYGAPAPLPMESPGYPPNYFPAQQVPYPVQSGFVPGIDGLVSPDGAINILPFSDAYSDLLEKHKQKIIRRRLQKLLDEYEYYPRKRCHRKGGCRY